MKRAMMLMIAMLVVGGVSLLNFRTMRPAVAQEAAPAGADPDGATAAQAATENAAGGATDAADDAAAAGSVSAAAIPAVSPPADQAAPESGGTEAPILDAASSRLSVQVLLKDGGGTPLVGPVNLAFRIYTGGGGLVEGPINLLGVPLTNGVADVQVPVTPSSFDGSERLLGVTVNPPAAELLPRIPLTTVAYALRVDRVTSEELDDAITLGGAGSGFGDLRLETNAGGLKTRIFGSTWGELNQFDGDGTQTVSLDAQNNSGGSLRLNDTDGGLRAFLSTNTTSGDLQLYDATGETVQVSGDGGVVSAEDSLDVVDAIGGTILGTLQSFSFGGRLDTFDENGALTTIIGSTSTGGFANFYQGDDLPIARVGVLVDGDSGGAGLIQVRGDNGSTRVTIDGDANSADGGGVITVNQADGSSGVIVDGDDTNADGGGSISLREADGSGTIKLRGQDEFGTGGDIQGFNSAGGLVFDVDTGSSGGVFAGWHDGSGSTTTNATTVSVSTTSGSFWAFRNAAGSTTVSIDSDSSGCGRVTTDILTVTGCDLAERFDVGAADGEVKPGMVVSIDPTNPGELRVSRKAYDRTVAGIVSGAGDVKPGMILGKGATVTAGRHPVALSGRVNCWVDTSNGAVEPGDLLTTSDVPGYAMKVTDHTKAQGAILGKAMSSLTEGQGLVLVLVTLQ